MRRVLRVLPAVLLLVALIGAWELYVDLGGVDPLVLSAPHEVAKAIYNDRGMGLVSGSGATIGIPDLRSGSVIELQGLGPRFSGQYYIKEATPSIGSNGYQTSFNVQRNAVS